MQKNILHKQALSIIEVMVGIFIFTLGISAIYMVISSTVNINSYNKNYIIASNLAREQIELIRNIRDSNYEKFQKWNILHPHNDGNNQANNYTTVFTGSNDYYKLENDFTSKKVNASTGSIVPDFMGALKTNNASKDPYRLCLDSQKRYIYCSGLSGEEKTIFYRYIEIAPLDKGNLGNSQKVEDALKVRSKVFWNQKGIHDTEIDTILTDWKRL